MRPGRNAPENRSSGSHANPSNRRFNEAGAKCPGEHSVQDQRGALVTALQ